MLNAISADCQTVLAARPAKVFYMEEFKTRLRRIRLRAGYRSHAAAADAIGCTRGTVGMWEAPSSFVRSVGSEWLFETARAYRVRPEWINDLESDADGFPWEPASQPARYERDTMRAAARIMERAREYIIGTVNEDALIDGSVDAALEVGPERILNGDGLLEGVRLAAAKIRAA